MSTTDSPAEAIKDAEEQFQDGNVEAAFNTLVDEVKDLNERVQELESNATVDWDNPNPAEMTIKSADGSNEIKPYLAINSKADEYVVEEIEERLEDLESGNADVVVRSETDRDALPIENRIGRREAGDDSLTANEERATLVFGKFATFSDSWNNKMALDSDGVRTVLAEQTDKDKEDWNTNTVNRTMRKVAELTSTAGEGERNPKDESNLITFETSGKRSKLVADREDWVAFVEEVSED